MAIKEMLPYKDDIIAMKEPPNVKTHDDVVEYLANTYNIKVSKPTITRFLQLHAPHLVNSRKLSPEEERAVVPFEAFLRVEAEIIAMREELGLQIDTLTERTVAKMAVLSAEIVELEKAINRIGPEHRPVPKHKPVRTVWVQAFLSAFLICLAGYTVLWFLLRP